MAVTSPSSCKFLYDFSLWYRLEDDPIATSIGEILTQQGFRGYIEHQDQVAGRSVVASAAEVVETSRVAIVLLTARSVADPWCQRVAEWNLLRTIQQEGTKVVPVYVDVSRDDVPLALRHLSGLEYSSVFFRERLLQSFQKARPRTRAQRPAAITNAKSRAPIVTSVSNRERIPVDLCLELNS
ncbi:UNVERIFIED_CONTAM: hypothetical protein K2H54_020256 [Gekko kuhli]